jgi:hypothetical protein
MRGGLLLTAAVGLTLIFAQLGFAQVGTAVDKDAARPGLAAVQSVTGMATVSSIDYEQGIATIKLSDGTTVTFKAGPEVESFRQLKVGDQVLIRN